MKQVLVTLALVFGSVNVFAGSKDLRILTVLETIGAQNDQFMSQAHYGITAVECAVSMQSRAAECTMQDAAANGGEGSSLRIEGGKARILVRLLTRLKAPTDSGMGKLFISAKSIQCTQAVDGVAEGSAEERTNCAVEI